MIFYLTSEANANTFDDIAEKIGEGVTKTRGIFNCKDIFIHKLKNRSFSMYGYLLIDFKALHDADNHKLFIECIETFSLIHKLRIMFYSDGSVDMSPLFEKLTGKGYYNFIEGQNAEELKSQADICFSVNGAEKSYASQFFGEHAGLQKMRGESPYSLLRDVKINVGTLAKCGGATSFALNIAAFISHNTGTVNYVDKMNSSMQHLKSIDGVEAHTDGGFSYGGIRLMTAFEQFDGNVNVTVNDFGMLDSGNIREYSEGDIKIICGGSKPWDTDEIFRFSDSMNSGYIFVFRCAADSEKSYIENRMREVVENGAKIFFLSYAPSLFDHEKNAEIFAEIIQSYK